MKLKLLLVTQLLILSFVIGVPCPREESLDISTGVVHPNSSITHNNIEYVSSAWYEVIDENITVTLGCPCIGRVCLWKCCGEGQMYINRNCTSTDLEPVNPFSPPVFNGREPSNVEAHQNFFYMYNRHCIERYSVDTLLDNEEVYIQENATLIEIAQNRPQWHLPRRYCVDMITNNISSPPRLIALVCYPEDTNATLIEIAQNRPQWHLPRRYCVDMITNNISSPPRLIALVCYPEDTVDDSPYLYFAYAIGLILSVPFLLATFLVYAFISELRNLHGMCLMAYCAGLIVAYPLLAYLKMSVGEVSVFRTGCLVLAFIIYYAFQTTFFWLNVMCFDIWRTFSGYRGGSSTKRREKKRFGLYGLYAWGVPLVLTAITAGMQFSSDIPQHIITPNFGDRRCWFEDWLSELVYFFTPVFILVLCNLVLFSVTAHRIRSIRQETAILKSSESSRSDKLKRDKQRYALYLKLFMVMGVNWTVEVISFAAGGSNWYWVLIDLSNIGLGFFIFFIFVWKNKVRNLIRKKFMKWRGGSGEGRPALSDSSTGRWATRSSSAPTEVTRVTSDEPGIRLKDLH